LSEADYAFNLPRGIGAHVSGKLGPLSYHAATLNSVRAHHSDAARRDYDIWRMCGDGTQLAALVVAPGQQLQISIAPDGNHLVYVSELDGQREIFRRPFGRGEATNLTTHPAEDSQPAWSPDGKEIAFFSDRDAEKLELYVLRLADGSVRRLTDNSYYDSSAAWSPAGDRLIFTRFFPGPAGGDHSGDGEIIQIDVESRREIQLTRLGGYNGEASYSPDGKWITFHRVADGRAELWLMNADGSGQKAITDTYIDEYTPQWSPDGNWIAFTAGTGNDSLGTFDIWIMQPDGSRRQVLNKAPNTEGWQRWRPGEHHCR
jgi:TolB protein